MGKIVTNKIAAIFLLLFSLNSFAQLSDGAIPEKEFRVNLETVMYQKLIETSSNGSSLFSSRDAPSVIFSVSKYYRLNYNLAIEPSIGLTVIPYNYNFDVELETNHPLYSTNQKVLKGSSYDFGLFSLN